MVAGLALGLGAMGFGCTSTDKSTQLTVVFTSEASIPSAVNVLQLTVTSNGSTSGPYTTYLSRDDDGFFPQTAALIPRDESSLNQPVTVTVSALFQGSSGNPTPVVVRTVTASYVEGHTLLLPMPLRMACFETNCDGAGQSCVGGQCVQATVDSASLVDYDDRYVFGQNYYVPGAAEQTGCFDDAACLAHPVQTSVNPDCSFDLPAGVTTSGGAPGVNASIEWDAAPGLIIVLDGDDGQEGWTPSPTDPTKGQLSPGVCLAVQRQALESQAKGFYLSSGCPAKSHLLPACVPSLNVGVPLSP
jgi:hypothetical protein